MSLAGRRASPAQQVVEFETEEGSRPRLRRQFLCPPAKTRGSVSNEDKSRSKRSHRFRRTVRAFRMGSRSPRRRATHSPNGTRYRSHSNPAYHSASAPRRGSSRSVLPGRCRRHLFSLFPGHLKCWGTGDGAVRKLPRPENSDFISKTVGRCDAVAGV